MARISSLGSQDIEVLDQNQVFQRLVAQKKMPYQSQYLAMYSSWLGGITLDPSLMLIPIDDHCFHRGDGVFEAIKVINGHIYLLEPHLARLQRSSEQIGLKWPHDLVKMREKIHAVVRAAGGVDSIIRLFLTRGPGGFTTNPYECLSAQLYIVVTKLQAYPEEKYKTGVTLQISQYPAKDPFFSQIKSCNYLPNVLMKKEAIDQKVDFVVSLDREGYLTESSTENIAMITQDGRFWVPQFHNTLRGTTLLRLMDLVRERKAELGITEVVERNLRVEDLKGARSVFLVGTTLDVLPVRSFAGLELNHDDHFKWTRNLREIIRLDQSRGPLSVAVST